MLIDSDFGAIEKRRNKEEKVYSPSLYIDLIKNCKKNNAFEDVYVEHYLEPNDDQAQNRVITTKNYKEVMNKYLKSSNPGISKARRSI